MLKKFDAFQFRGIRQILKWESTYAQKLKGVPKTNTNEALIREAEKLYNQGRVGPKPYKDVLRFSDFYGEERRKSWSKYAERGSDDPVRGVIFRLNSVEPLSYGFKRKGGQRNHWAKTITTGVWEEIRSREEDDNLRYSSYSGTEYQQAKVRQCLRPDPPLPRAVPAPAVVRCTIREDRSGTAGE